MVLVAVLAGVIDHPGLVHLDLGLGDVARIHATRAHLVVVRAAEVAVAATVDVPLGVDHGPGDRDRDEGVGGVQSPGVRGTGGLAGAGPASLMRPRGVNLPGLGLRDDLLGNLNPAEIIKRFLVYL